MTTFLTDFPRDSLGNQPGTTQRAAALVPFARRSEAIARISVRLHEVATPERTTRGASISITFPGVRRMQVKFRGRKVAIVPDDPFGMHRTFALDTRRGGRR